MTSMHPHWQSTEDEQIVPVHVREHATEVNGVSRLPAALLGIVVMLGAVAYSFGGHDAIIGQVTNPTPDITIHLKTSGPDISPATVRPGQVIRWVNDDQIPQVLSSQTLPTADGKQFVTAGMFPDSDYFYTVPLTATDGTHAYVSETKPDYKGEIIITTAAPSANTSGATSVAAPASSSIATLPVISSAAPLPLPGQNTSVAPSPLPAGVIAVNPHVVGKAGKTSSKKAAAVTQHKPTKHTESGPETMILIGCSLLALAIAAKGAFRTV